MSNLTIWNTGIVSVLELDLEDFIFLPQLLQANATEGNIKVTSPNSWLV